MSTLAAWQSFARSTNLRGWSRLKKNELVKFLVENLWQGGGPKKAARWKNPLNWKKKNTGAYFNSGKKKLSIESHSQSD